MAGNDAMLLLSTLAPPPSPTGAPQEESQKLLTLDHADQVTIKQEETENTNGNGPFQMRAAISESETNDHTDQVAIKQEETENTNGNGPFQMRAAISEPEINDDDYMDENWILTACTVFRALG